MCVVKFQKTLCVLKTPSGHDKQTFKVDEDEEMVPD